MPASKQTRSQTGLTSEMYIGLFVLLAIIFLTGFMIWFKSMYFGPQQRFVVSFTEIGGLKPNAPVTISGVRVGTVDRIELKAPRNVLITVRMDPAVFPIRQGAHFEIETFGLLGAKYMEIEPPGPTDGEPPEILTDKTIEVGEEPVVVEKVLNRLGKGLNALNLEEDSAVIERSLQKLEKLEDTMYTTSNKFGTLATDVRTTNKKVDNALSNTDLKKTLNNMQDASENINKAAMQTNQILDSKHPLLHMIFGRPGHIKDKETVTTTTTNVVPTSDVHGKGDKDAKSEKDAKNDKDAKSDKNAKGDKDAKSDKDAKIDKDAKSDKDVKRDKDAKSDKDVKRDKEKHDKEAKHDKDKLDKETKKLDKEAKKLGNN